MPETTASDLRDRLTDALENRDPRAVKALAAQLEAPDLADILPALTHERLDLLRSALGDEEFAEVIAQLDPTIAARVLARLRTAQAADVLDEMQPDEAADVVGEFGDAAREGVLREMQREEAADVRELLEYPPESAGGRMTTEFVSLRETMTVDDALQSLRRAGEDAHAVFYLYVADDSGRLAGVTTLRDIVISPGSRRIGEITNRDVVSIEATEDQERAAELLRERGYLALPVVGPDRKLLGVITADDVAEVIEEEASEDIERLGGSQPLEEPYLTASLFHLFRKRILWLLVLFAAEAYTGTVLRAYEDEISKVVALTFFIPLLIGTGGNTGTQVVSTLVRSIAVGEVDLKDVVRVFTREVVVGTMLGIAMAVAAYIRAFTLGVGLELGPVVALTAFCVVVWAAFVASILPLVLHRLRLDPAVISGPFISTLVDGTGLIIYFTIAKFVLNL